MRFEGREDSLYLKPILQGKCKLCFFSTCFLDMILFHLKKLQIYLPPANRTSATHTGLCWAENPEGPKVLYGITQPGHLAQSNCWADLGHIWTLKTPVWSKVSLPKGMLTGRKGRHSEENAVCCGTSDLTQDWVRVNSQESPEFCMLQKRSKKGKRPEKAVSSPPLSPPLPQPVPLALREKTHSRLTAVTVHICSNNVLIYSSVLIIHPATSW